MGKGILLELEGRQAVVLTPQGEFKRIPLPKGAWDIGDEVSYADTKPVPWQRWGTWAAAAVLMLVSGFKGYDVYALAQPVALVTVDINPSLELTLNKENDVLKAQALNADGSKVLEGIDWKRQHVDEVVAAVTAKAVDLGKLKPEDAASAVVLAVAPARAKDLTAEQTGTILAEAKVAANQTIAKKAEEKKVTAKANVAAISVTKEERDEAHAKKSSFGRLGLAKDFQEELPQVQPEKIVEELMEKGPGSLAKDLGVNLGDILGKAEEHRNPNSDKDGKKNEKQDDKQGSKSEEEKSVPAAGKGDDKQNGQGNGADKKPADDKSPGGKKVDEEKKDEGKKDSSSVQGNGNGKGNGNGNGNRKAQEEPKAKGNSGNQNTKKSSNEGFLNKLKSWLGFDQDEKKPRAETPGEGASEDEQAAPPQAEEKQPEPKVEEKKPEPKVEEKKPEPKVDEKRPEPKVEEKKPEPKVEEKKPEPKVEEKKPEPKVEEKQPEPKVEEKKPEPKAEEKKPEPKAEEKADKPSDKEEKGGGSDKEQEKGKDTGKSQGKP